MRIMKKNYMNIHFPQVAEKRNYETVNENKTSYKSTKSTQNKMNEITKMLEEGVHKVFESDNYKNYLNTMSKFHNYSMNNTLLIARQNPDATLVAGFKSWEKNFGRHVKKDEKGIKILAPSQYKKKVMVEKVDPVSREIMLDTNGNPVKEETEVKMTAYRIVSVFDVSQTEGKPLPQMGVAELTDNVNEYELFVEALKQSTSVPISFENISGAAKGYYNPVTASITIKAGMPESQTVKTMIHEIAHSILHNDILDEDAKKDRQTKEVEAESVAYTVCQHFGIDTSDYSFGYIAGWSSSKETEELKQSLETIQKTASGLINDIERIMPQLKKDMQLKENVTESVTENIDEPEIEYTAGMRI